MVEHNTTTTHQLDRIFHALSDPTRRAMILTLSEGEHNIRSLAEPFSMSFAAASKHVKVLESAGLIDRRVQGRSHFCRLRPARLAAAKQWLAYYDRFWTQRLDDLETLLTQDIERETTADD
ncbi:transcriptional regulator [Pseudohongiella acticola]|jgi:DNA-binding transcriptional ArsR family regulator|uniref:Transcriptional regulator n=1 Tax=Pseudohongiella acticola TaxID=1524254 RepID=A0A1E8CLP1_9GAMM|nr:metalloregulator ArsR/SmtB family transcription factor [Pseudohongiella acticola]OFE13177.1 transcriptional regulator [Pseudohongiella acticola]